MTQLRKSSATAGLILLLALALSGCVRLDRSVNLNSDGSGTFALQVGFSTQLLSLVGNDAQQQLDTAIRQSAAKSGAKVTASQSDGYDYWKLSYTFKNIAQLNTLLNTPPDLGSAAATTGLPTTGGTETFKVTQTSGFLSNTYHVTGNLDFSGGTGAGAIGTTGPGASLLADARETFAVTFPGGVSAHKGGTVSGDTVTYTLKFGDTATVDATGGSSAGSAIGLGVGGLVVLLAIGGLAFFLLRRRNTAVAPASPAPFGPASTYPQPTSPFTPPSNADTSANAPYSTPPPPVYPPVGQPPNQP